MNTYFGAPNVRNLAWVPRWVIMKRNRTQSVAEHSFFVALYSIDVAKIVELGVEFYPNLLQYALTHDMEEMITGDLPAPYKHALPSTAAPWIVRTWEALEAPISLVDNDVVRQIVKTADLIDSFLYLEEEVQMGNMIAADHIEKIRIELMEKSTYLDSQDLMIAINRLVMRTADWAKPKVIR